MNLARPPLTAVSQAFRFWLALRRLLPRRKCRTFGVHRAEKGPGVGKIYVINLDREPGRWSKMEQELRHILDSSGSGLLSLTERHAAVDANAFSQEPPKDADIDPHYTLGDQLFVEPQPLALPTQLELNAPIRMSRAEIAVARSHMFGGRLRQVIMRMDSSLRTTYGFIPGLHDTLTRRGTKS
jgi:hypothetical protein